MLKNITAFAEKLPVLHQRIDDLQGSGDLESSLSKLAILPGGEKVRGKELELCKQFIKAVEKKLEASRSLTLGAELKWPFPSASAYQKQ